MLPSGSIPVRAPFPSLKNSHHSFKFLIRCLNSAVKKYSEIQRIKTLWEYPFGNCTSLSPFTKYAPPSSKKI